MDLRVVLQAKLPTTLGYATGITISACLVLVIPNIGAGIAGTMFGVSSEMYFYAVAEGGKLLRSTIIRQLPVYE